MNEALTQFQVQEAELQRRLAAIGLELRNRTVEGATEQFVSADIGEVRVWIYLDEACVIGGGIDRVFERWDYDSPEQLRDAFVEQVVGLFRRR
jgi:hypothetical protein